MEYLNYYIFFGGFISCSVLFYLIGWAQGHYRGYSESMCLNKRVFIEQLLRNRKLTCEEFLKQVYPYESYIL